MDAPPVQYVTTSDGYNIAYTVCGEGTPLVFMSSPFMHVQLYWSTPGALRHLFDKIGVANRTEAAGYARDRKLI